jgi:hypothetical protein
MKITATASAAILLHSRAMTVNGNGQKRVIMRASVGNGESAGLKQAMPSQDDLAPRWPIGCQVKLAAAESYRIQQRRSRHVLYHIRQADRLKVRPYRLYQLQVLI